MPLTPGTRIGGYEITAPIGAGAMGEVYRARDLRLDREVALKLLPEGFIADEERRARFEREARLLGALNHPNIAAIYGFEEDLSDSGRYISALILELVDGVTLAERIAQRPLTVDEAIAFARQLAGALDAAHEKGIVHRDLNPANIKLTSKGLVKVLDFGLARATEESTSFHAAATRPAGGTLEGVILGTASYMSPEQARGRAVDKRTDVWAFGCVLYEMLTGARAFPGDTLSDVIADVLGREPNWAALPATTPTSLRRLLSRCLEKDPSQRLRDIGDAGLVLEDVAEDGAGVGTSWNATRMAAVAGAAALIVATIGAANLWFNDSTAPIRPDRAVRWEVAPPPGGAFVQNVETVSMAFSPDGTRLAFVATDAAGVPQLWLRAIDVLAPAVVPGTEGASSVFWSPDSESIAFFADGSLKRLNLRGGSPIVICSTPAGVGLTGTWGEHGEALFASAQGEAIFRVSMNGGDATKVVTPDASLNESRSTWPWFLPDGQRFLYLRTLLDGRSHLMLGGDGEPRALMPMQSKVQYVDPGYLVFANEGILLGQRIDLGAGRLTGEPIPIGDAVHYFRTNGWAQFATSRTGAVAFQPHSDQDRLAWFDRTGREISSFGSPGASVMVRISPDGRKALIDRRQPATSVQNIWLVDLERNVDTPLTSGQVTETMPAWMPDSLGFFFSIAGSNTPTVHRSSLLGEAPTRMLPPRGLQTAQDVSPDGRFLVFSERGAQGQRDLLLLSLEDGKEGVLAGSPVHDESSARFSPDGRHIAYVSNQSGRDEVYVMPFPATGQRTQVSPAGGRHVRWTRDGRELLYLSADNSVMAAPIVETGATLRLRAPVRLFTLPNDTFWRDFDVSADGTRLLAIVPVELSSMQPVTVVSDWLSSIETGSK